MEEKEREIEGGWRWKKKTVMIIGENLSIIYPISPLRLTPCHHNCSITSVIAIKSLVTQL